MKSIAQVCVCRTLSPRPDSLSIRTHAREVETLTLSERHFRLSTCRNSMLITPGKDTLLIFAVSSYLQYLSILYNDTMCSKHGKPAVPIHLTLMPSSSVGRNSDPFLGLPVPTARAPHFSFAQVSTQEIATKNVF